MRRRSLSEVIGAVIVLAVVVLAALSLLRLGSQVVLYAERVSSSQFAREAQMSSPPEMSVVLRNSSLYLLVSSSVPINISYAVIQEAGRVYVERVDEGVSGQALLRLLTNYSCQNVSIFLVSSTGAVFRYEPYNDPLLMGRAPQGVDYFSCAFVNSTGPSSASSGPGYQQVYLGPDSFRLPNNVVFVGLQGSGGSFESVGKLQVKVRMSGWFCSESVVASVGNVNILRSFSGPIAYLGWVNVSGVNVSLLAFCQGWSTGIVILPASGYVTFSAVVNATVTAQTPYTSPIGPVTAAALGFTGNFTASGSTKFLGSDWTSSGLYYYWGFYSRASGKGATLGPIALLIGYGLGTASGGNFTLSAVINATVVKFTGNASLTLEVPGPVTFKALSLSASGSYPPIIGALMSSLQYVTPSIYLTFYTQEGAVTRSVSSGEFLVPFYQVAVTMPYGPSGLLEVGPQLKPTNNGWIAYAVNVTPFPFVTPTMLELNSTGVGTLVLVSPTWLSDPLQVGQLTEDGPVIAIPLGVDPLSCVSPMVARLSLQGYQAYVRLPWSNLTEGTTPGVYLLYCKGQGGYLAIIS